MRIPSNDLCRFSI